MADQTLARSHQSAGRLIAMLRPILAPLSITNIAAQLNITVRRHEFRGPTRGAALGGETIVLDLRLSGRASAYTFAHEVAHILIQREVLHVADPYQETFADSFARELLLPRAWLGAGVNGPAAARRFDVSQATVAVQLAALGEAPALQRLGVQVLCASCGSVGYRLPCICNDWRRRAPGDRYALPHVHEHPAWRSHEHSDLVLFSTHIR
jgi:uncharacterized protein DUF955